MTSIIIDPAAASVMRNNAKVMELLPAPVRPTIPTWCETLIRYNMNSSIYRLSLQFSYPRSVDFT